jgi:hypothetical protein
MIHEGTYLASLTTVDTVRVANNFADFLFNGTCDVMYVRGIRDIEGRNVNTRLQHALQMMGSWNQDQRLPLREGSSCRTHRSHRGWLDCARLFRCRWGRACFLGCCPSHAVNRAQMLRRLRARTALMADLRGQQELCE